MGTVSPLSYARHQEEFATSCVPLSAGHKAHRSKRRNIIFWSFFYAGLLRADLVYASTPCKRVVWMTSLAGQMTRYTELMRVALHSATLNAPSIVPVIVAEGPSLAMPQMHKFAMYAESKGAIVTTHNLTFLHDFKPDSHHYRVRGAYLRLECGLIFKRLLAEKRLDPDDVDTDFILYADSDSMFLQDIDSCTLSQPAVALLGPEANRGILANDGIMYINVSAWNLEHAAIVKHGRTRKWDFPALDQGLILDFYGSRLEALPDYFNWKGCVFHCLSWELSKAMAACVPRKPDGFHFVCPRRCSLGHAIHNCH